MELNSTLHSIWCSKKWWSMEFEESAQQVGCPMKSIWALYIWCSWYMFYHVRQRKYCPLDYRSYIKQENTRRYVRSVMINWSISHRFSSTLLLLLSPNSIKTADECWWLQMGLHNFDIIMISSMQCELQQHENGYASEPNMIVSRIQYGDMGCLDLTKLRKCSTLYNKEPKIFHELLKFVSTSRFFQVHKVPILFC